MEPQQACLASPINLARNDTRRVPIVVRYWKSDIAPGWVYDGVWELRTAHGRT